MFTSHCRVLLTLNCTKEAVHSLQNRCCWHQIAVFRTLLTLISCMEQSGIRCNMWHVNTFVRVLTKQWLIHIDSNIALMCRLVVT